MATFARWEPVSQNDLKEKGWRAERFEITPSERRRKRGNDTDRQQIRRGREERERLFLFLLLCCSGRKYRRERESGVEWQRNRCTDPSTTVVILACLSLPFYNGWQVVCEAAFRNTAVLKLLAARGNRTNVSRRKREENNNWEFTGIMETKQLEIHSLKTSL